MSISEIGGFAVIRKLFARTWLVYEDRDRFGNGVDRTACRSIHMLFQHICACLMRNALRLKSLKTLLLLLSCVGMAWCQCLADDPLIDTPTFGPSRVVVAEPLPKDKVAEQHAIEQQESAYITDLIKLLNSDDYNSQVEAHFALLQAVTSAHMEFLAGLLKKGNSAQAQVAIVESLAKVGDRRVIEALIFELKHGEVETKRAIVSALGKLGDDYVVPILFQILTEEGDYESRIRAANALAEIKTVKSIYSLKAARSRYNSSRFQDFSMVRVIDWAIGAADGAYSSPVTDQEVPIGRPAKLRFNGLDYMFLRPPLMKRELERPWLMVCVHDNNYEVKRLRDLCYKHFSSGRPMALLIPIFDSVRYIDYGSLNYRGERADKILNDLLDFLATAAKVRTREVFMLGTGDGGDFVQRYAFLYPERVSRVVVDGKRHITLDIDQYYPAGLRPSPFAPDMVFDTYRMAKVDMAIVLDKDKHRPNALPRLLKQMDFYKNSESIMHRLAVRWYRARDPIGFWAEASDYFFREN